MEVQNNLEQVILELKRISKNHDLSLVFSEAASNIIDENLFRISCNKNFSIKKL